MIRHAWSVLCERVITDKDSNNVTLSVLEQVSFRYDLEGAAPGDGDRIVMPISGVIVSMWYKGEDDPDTGHKIRINLLDFEKKPIGGGTGELNFEGLRRTRAMVPFTNVPVPPQGSGLYFFVVEHEVKNQWERVAEIPFEIHITRTEVTSPAKPTPP